MHPKYGSDSPLATKMKCVLQGHKAKLKALKNYILTKIESIKNYSQKFDVEAR